MHRFQNKVVFLIGPDLLDPNLGDEILEALRQHGVAPTSLVLEITEGAVMKDPALAVRNMQLLRIAGVRFSLDDFADLATSELLEILGGSGLSSEDAGNLIMAARASWED